VRRPWSVLGLLLGGTLLLVALYLPWQRFSVDLSGFGEQRGTVGSLLDLFAGSEPLEGWDSAVAPAAALAALLLVALSAVAWARPSLVVRLPLGRCALVAAYFALAVAVSTRSHATWLISGSDADAAGDARFAYGTYVGLGAAAVTLLAALLLRRAELPEHRSPTEAAAVLLVSGLLLAFLLPWTRFAGFENTGIAGPAAQVGVVFAVCIPSAWSPRTRLALAVLAGLFTAAAFSTTTFPYGRAYGAWVGIGFALGLVALSLRGGVRRPDIQGVPWSRLVLGSAGLLLVASFFLPWQEFCYPAEPTGPTSGRCVSVNGWESESAAGAAVLAIMLILGELAHTRRLPPRVYLAAGIALLVATLGFQFGHGGPFSLGYGFWVGAVCASLMVVLAAVGVGRPPLDARLAPIALCLVYLAIVVPTWWGVLSFDAPRFFWFAPFSWITIAGALLALTLIRLWLEGAPDTRSLFLVPAVIAVLAALDLVRAETITWGGGIVLGLCALLALFAWVEHAGGLRRLEIPGALRLDRL
jgi:small basic protein